MFLPLFFEAGFLGFSTLEIPIRTIRIKSKEIIELLGLKNSLM
jgi:hypothetical protein